MFSERIRQRLLVKANRYVFEKKSFSFVIIWQSEGCFARPGKMRMDKYSKHVKSMFAGFVLLASRPFCCMFFVSRVPGEKKDDSIRSAVLEALAWHFIYFRESDVHTRHFQARRIEGPGRV